jgi:hypothetical protein
MNNFKESCYVREGVSWTPRGLIDFLIVKSLRNKWSREGRF